ncbi:tRNA pseudouridine synthase 1 [Podochytrium sp. JEL0797]|nr:tRNA pseudouridine synthase 1 [Podochytrium sp. JEL0797]
MLKLAVLYGYSASAVDAESLVLSAIASASCTALDDESESVRLTTQTTQMTGISRACAAERGEFCARQVLSLEVLSASATLPHANQVNQLLPQSVRVFKVLRVDKAFSARRMCDLRVYEYLIPTYAFAPPPPQTGFPFKPEPSQDAINTFLNEANLADSSIFTTLSTSLKRSTSQKKVASKSFEKKHATNTSTPELHINHSPFPPSSRTLSSNSQLPSLITKGIAEMAAKRDSMAAASVSGADASSVASSKPPKSPGLIQQSLSTSYGNFKSFLGGLKKKSSNLVS